MLNRALRTCVFPMEQCKGHWLVALKNTQLTSSLFWQPAVGSGLSRACPLLRSKADSLLLPTVPGLQAAGDGGFPSVLYFVPSSSLKGHLMWVHSEPNRILLRMLAVLSLQRVHFQGRLQKIEDRAIFVGEGQQGAHSASYS